MPIVVIAQKSWLVRKGWGENPTMLLKAIFPEARDEDGYLWLYEPTVDTGVN